MESLKVSFNFPGGGVNIKRGRSDIDLTPQDLEFLANLDTILSSNNLVFEPTEGVTENESTESTAAGN